MSNNQRTLPVTIWYGERGIVNSIVTHIASRPNPGKTAGKLLDAVQWADAGKHAWTSQIAEVKLIVEISLADFGNPDLMLVCTVEGDDQPYCVFIEAKATCYQFSMGNNSSGMSPGFNSTINGQISLKYRFAKALCNPASGIEEVVEPESIFKKYKEQLRDYSQKPRHLRKPEILQLLNDLKLISLSEDRCHYVALTWDDAKHAFFADSDVKRPDNMPLLLDEYEKDVYDTVKPRLGWLGYKNLEEALDLHSDEYKRACCGMFSNLEPTQKDYDRLRAVAGMPEYDKDFLDDLFGRFREACEQNAKFFHKRCRGSYSLGVAGKTLAKLIPEGDLLFVGVRDDGKKDHSHTNMQVEKTVQGVLFRGIVLKPDSDSIDKDLYMKDILHVFKEMTAQHSS